MEHFTRSFLLPTSVLEAFPSCCLWERCSVQPPLLPSCVAPAQQPCWLHTENILKTLHLFSASAEDGMSQDTAAGLRGDCCAAAEHRHHLHSPPVPSARGKHQLTPETSPSTAVPLQSGWLRGATPVALGTAVVQCVSDCKLQLQLCSEAVVSHPSALLPFMLSAGCSSAQSVPRMPAPAYNCSLLFTWTADCSQSKH